jgi:hypothetical protein
VRSPSALVPGPAYFQHQMVLTPKQVGYVGSYSRDMLQVEEMRDRAFGDVLLRFTTSILSGRTVTEKQRASVKVPATWWQHLKKTAADWHAGWLGKEHRAWRLFILLLDVIIVPLASLIPWFLRRRPVRYAELAAEVRFSREMLYPGADISLPHDTFGTPVMYETTEIAPAVAGGEPWGLEDYGPARFMDRREIAHEILRDAGLAAASHASGLFGGGMDPGSVFGVFEWLGQHGVSVDQLVARSAL